VLVMDEREIREGTSHACSFLYQPAARRVDLCAFSFASLAVQAIEASARFGGVVAGTRGYLLAARAPWLPGSGAPGGWSAGRHGLALFQVSARPKYRPSTLKGLDVAAGAAGVRTAPAAARCSLRAPEDSCQPVLRIGARQDDM
jgi:hypothetical protein